MSCMNVQVKCQSCEVLYTVMPLWERAWGRRGEVLEPKYSHTESCKNCGSDKLLVSAQHGPPPKQMKEPLA